MARPRSIPYPELADVLAVLAEDEGPDGIRVGDVWRALGPLGTSYLGTQRRLAELVDRGNLRREGERAGTRYFLVSTEIEEIVERTKLCSDCLIEKPVSAFSGGGPRLTDYRVRCRSCEREMSAVATGNVCQGAGCHEQVLTPGLCGFCIEESRSERLTTPAAPTPRNAAENRRDVALAVAGHVSRNAAATLP